jgi:hypothetical protein
MSEDITTGRPKHLSSNEITTEANPAFAFDEPPGAERGSLTLKDVVRPRTRLFTPGQVALATFLGGPLAGFLLLSANDARLVRSSGWGTFWRGVGFSLVIFVVAVVLELIFPLLPLLLAVINPLILYSIADGMHGDACREHQARGGRSGTVGGLIGRSFLGGFLLLALSLLFGCILNAVLLSAHPQRFN